MPRILTTVESTGAMKDHEWAIKTRLQEIAQQTGDRDPEVESVSLSTCVTGVHVVRYSSVLLLRVREQR